MKDIFTLSDEAPDFYDVLKSRLRSVSKENIALDLTGGLDSRFLLSNLLLNNIDFTASSAGFESHDVQIPFELSKVGDFNYFHYEHNPKEIIDDIDDILYLSNGQYNILNCHRRYRLYLERIKKGSTLCICGHGGDAIRNNNWLALWPFYSKKNSDVSNFYYKKLKPKIYSHIFSGSSMEKYALNFDEAILKKLKKYNRTPARLAFDAVGYYFYLTTAVRTFDDKLIPTFTPLRDPDLVFAASNLPIRMRNSHRLYRSSVTKAGIELARIKTDRGQNMIDSEWEAFKGDVVFVSDVFGRIYRRLRYYISGKNRRPTADHPEYMKYCRQLSQFKDA